MITHGGLGELSGHLILDSREPKTYALFVYFALCAF